MKEEMATYSSILAWRIPWTEKPGGLQSMGSLLYFALPPFEDNGLLFWAPDVLR